MGKFLLAVLALFVFWAGIIAAVVFLSEIGDDTGPPLLSGVVVLVCFVTFERLRAKFE